MRVLRLSDCGKLDIPSGAFSFANLRTLDLSETSALLLADSIGQLKQLSLPECITELAKLQYLNISESSQVSTLPESICKLVCLECLGLSRCSRIPRLPESFGDLKCMHLKLSNCSSLQELPESLCGIKQLQHLKLSSCNCLQWLPEAIGNLADLQYLNMSECQEIKKPPESMMKLHNLLHLDLSGCGGMEMWLKLRLVCCKVNAVDFIGNLTNLEGLDLSGNPLVCLPKSVGNLKRLQMLNLSYCQKLLSLPDSIVFEVLADDVSGCRKLHLLEGAHHISELQILSLENARCLEEARKAKLADKHNLSELTLDWTVGVDRHLEDSDLLGQLASATKNSGTLVSRRLQQYRLSRLGHGRHFSLPHLEELSLDRWPSITKTGWEFCGGKGAFRRLSNFKISFMEGLEEWSTAYYAEEALGIFMKLLTFGSLDLTQR
ncbi:hypothetical protein PVAP13_J683266 [Panicum virgatum]|nr:hypothetical protein PVAP13_J683266 [Panicum virgatum]